jgi:hypothetical protein
MSLWPTCAHKDSARNALVAGSWRVAIAIESADVTRGGRVCDVIFDLAGKSSFGRRKRSLSETGKYLSAALAPGILFHVVWT